MFVFLKRRRESVYSDVGEHLYNLLSAAENYLADWDETGYRKVRHIKSDLELDAHVGIMTHDYVLVDGDVSVLTKHDHLRLFPLVVKLYDRLDSDRRSVKQRKHNESVRAQAGQGLAPEGLA
jgi:hypothetical protein